MKSAVIFFLPIATSSTILWRWRSTDGAVHSERSFLHYGECRADARTQGYDVETVQDAPAIQPGGRFSAEEQREQYEYLLAADPGPTRH